MRGMGSNVATKPNRHQPATATKGTVMSRREKNLAGKLRAAGRAAVDSGTEITGAVCISEAIPIKAPAIRIWTERSTAPRIQPGDEARRNID